MRRDRVISKGRASRIAIRRRRRDQGNITADSAHRRTGPTFSSSTRVHALGAALAAAGFAADAALEQGVAAGVLYVAMVATSSLVPGTRSTLGMGVAATLLTMLGYFVSPLGGPTWLAATNRLLAVFAIWVTVALVGRHKRLTESNDRAEQRALRSEQQFRATVEASPTGMLLVDQQGRIALANLEAERLFGYLQGELLGQPIEILVPEPERAAHSQHRAAFAAEAAPQRMGNGREITGVDKQGSALSLEIGLARIVTPDGEFVLATVTDASARKQLEQARGAQALARRLRDAEEKLRKRMAREIHDALGQALTALKLDIGWLAQHLPDEPAQLHTRAAAMEDLASRTIDDVRRLSAELRPAVLDDQGLLAAIRWLVSDFEKHSGLRCTVALPDAEIAWGDDRSTAAFRVLQESLTNVARHAQARRVAVALWHEQQGDAVLEVRDDGCGVSPEQAARPGALGLLGMRERAQLIGGSLTVTGVLGAGTTVTLRMPCVPDMPLNGSALDTGRAAPKTANEGT